MLQWFFTLLKNILILNLQKIESVMVAMVTKYSCLQRPMMASYGRIANVERMLCSVRMPVPTLVQLWDTMTAHLLPISYPLAYRIPIIVQIRHSLA